MQRILASLVLLAALGAAHAQTIKITTANGTCTYPTGTVSSDPATPGQLLATVPSGQTPSGTGCGSTGGTSAPVSFGPASPLTLTTAMPLSNSGGVANFTFQPLNASQCNASVTPSTGVTFTSSVCNGNCTGAQSFNATFPANANPTTENTYAVSVSCTGPGSSTGVQSPPTPVTAQVHVSPTSVVTSTCPVITSTTTGIASFSQWSGTQKVYTDSGVSNNALKTADVGSFSALYGTWPGPLGNILYLLLPTNKYLTMQFTVPNNFMTASNKPNPLYGAYESGETGNKANYSITISTTCGDFSNPVTYPAPASTVVPGCWKNKLATKGLLQWNSTGSSCVLQNNKSYYLNFINADISLVQPGGGTAASTKTVNCAGGVCELPIYNGPGTWGGYTPQ
jgi:hypothetical protein